MLIGEKVFLTGLERSDLTANYIWGNDREVIALSGMNPYPKSSWQIEKWYESSLTNSNGLLLAIRTREEKKYIGNIELTEIDVKNSCCQLGIIIGDRDFRQQGHGLDAVNTLVDFAFGELNLHRVFARVLSYNQAAQQLFKKAGFIEEGREREAFYCNHKYWDIVFLSRLSTDKSKGKK